MYIYIFCFLFFLQGVTISERQNEEIIVEDLEDNVSRKHAGGFVSDSSEFPESRVSQSGTVLLLNSVESLQGNIQL